MTLAEFVEKYNLKLRWRRGRAPKNSKPSSRFFVCKILVGGHRGKQITVYYEMEAKKHGDPQLLDVLEYARTTVALDALFREVPASTKTAAQLDDDMRRAFHYHPGALGELFKCE